MHERFAEWLARRGEGDSPEWELELSGHPPAEFIGEMCAYLAA